MTLYQPLSVYQGDFDYESRLFDPVQNVRANWEANLLKKKQKFEKLSKVIRNAQLGSAVLDDSIIV